MKNLILVSFLIIILISGCSSDSDPKPENFDYGEVENNIYKNTFFNFRIDLPIDWIVQSREFADDLAKTGQEIIAGDDAMLRRALKVSEVNTANLLAVFQYEVGAPVDYNANIMIVAENLKNVPGIKTGSDYLFQTKKLLKQSQVQYDYLSDEFQKVIIGGTEFYRMKGQINYFGIDIKQAYYSTVLKGFSLNIIISWFTDEQETELLKSINSIKFI